MLAEAVRLDPWAHLDETPWRQDHKKATPWVAQGDRATHCRIGPHRYADTVRAILGVDPDKVALCDRFGAYNWVRKRSWCWAHLRRDFQAMIDRDDGVSAVGSRSLKRSDGLFWGWHRVADDELS